MAITLKTCISNSIVPNHILALSNEEIVRQLATLFWYIFNTTKVRILSYLQLTPPPQFATQQMLDHLNEVMLTDIYFFPFRDTMYQLHSTYDERKVKNKKLVFFSLAYKHFLLQQKKSEDRMKQYLSQIWLLQLTLNQMKRYWSRMYKLCKKFQSGHTFFLKTFLFKVAKS